MPSRYWYGNVFFTWCCTYVETILLDHPLMNTSDSNPGQAMMLIVSGCGNDGEVSALVYL
ncbi:hypothetical protein K491DRAFT_687157 [Lophiostoma macrostomum CBS 122681]|uniref:Uncharacterized protein n=1 Tax=Lophiostoma macrostomum CBS 122681 TaxID=1314788 RepID=A0A6A6TNW9_9PLEO|nr:hypothetical protein K491DRAFT_687157 [Lophiostoma macrostomum CBS 122681]